MQTVDTAIDTHVIISMDSPVAISAAGATKTATALIRTPRTLQIKVMIDITFKNVTIGSFFMIILSFFIPYSQTNVQARN